MALVKKQDCDDLLCPSTARSLERFEQRLKPDVNALLAVSKQLGQAPIQYATCAEPAAVEGVFSAALAAHMIRGRAGAVSNVASDAIVPG